MIIYPISDEVNIIESQSLSDSPTRMRAVFRYTENDSDEEKVAIYCWAYDKWGNDDSKEQLGKWVIDNEEQWEAEKQEIDKMVDKADL